MNFWNKYRLKGTLIAVAIGYIIVSLPVSLVFVKSDHVRFVYFETIGNWKGKVFGLNKVFCGDSLTAGGRNWSVRMTGHPFDSVNLAGSSYTIRQVELQLEKAKAYSPTYLFILAGTNDILDNGFEENRFTTDYRRLIARALEVSPNVVVTLVPYTTEIRGEIGEANEIIRDICEEHGIDSIDLNPLVAPEGSLLPEYTDDGLHFSKSAHNIWLDEIQKCIAKD